MVSSKAANRCHLLCHHKMFMVAQSKSRQNCMAFVMPQMYSFVAVTKGNINLHCYFAADIYFKMEEGWQPGVACALPLPQVGTPRASGSQSSMAQEFSTMDLSREIPGV